MRTMILGEDGQTAFILLLSIIYGIIAIKLIYFIVYNNIYLLYFLVTL